MLRTKWMMICLIIGSVLAVATMSCMPIFSDSVMHRMMIQDLQDYQEKDGYYPGRYLLSFRFEGKSYEDDHSVYQTLNDGKADAFVEQLGLPVQASTHQFASIGFDTLSTKDAERYDESEHAYHSSSQVLFALENIQEHITMISGEYPSSEMVDGIYEVMLTRAASERTGLNIGDTATMKSFSSYDFTIEFQIRVSGVFEQKDPQDLYWFQNATEFNGGAIMDYDCFIDNFASKTDEELIRTSNWYYALDYKELSVSQVRQVVSALRQQSNELPSGVKLNVPMSEILSEYMGRLDSLTLTLSMLQIPVVLMLIFYIFMVSQLLITHDRNEIAVYKSRGASRLQIFSRYLIQGLVIGAIAIIIGPPLGYLICRMLGLSNGFLEFVNRSGVRVELSTTAYLYGLLAVGVFLITMLIPVWSASKVNIVRHKRSRSRNTNRPLWQKLFLDVVLLGVSLYGWYRYEGVLQSGAKQTASSGIDPLMYLFSTMFILGAGLLFLRVYPLIVRLIFKIGQKKWTPALYSSLLNVSRGKGQSQFLMIFLVLTISIGLFNSVSARSLNLLVEDNTYYTIGADVSVRQVWGVNYVVEQVEVLTTDGVSVSEFRKIRYSEPDYTAVRDLDAVEKVARVFRRDDAVVTYNPTSAVAREVAVRGIVPSEFNDVAWTRADLLPAPMTEYLNVMNRYTNAAVISRQAASALSITQGDEVTISWMEADEMKNVTVTVIGLVDYWPGINTEKSPQFIIANLRWIHAQTPIEPYDLWITKAEGVTSTELYQQIEDAGVFLSDAVDAGQTITETKVDSLLQGTNGALTLSFIITMVVAFVGFLIYWIFNIRERTLQFGILRAMGLSRRKLVGMIIWEQVLLSGSAILAGILIGILTCGLFVPMYQILYSPAQLLPGFRVIAYAVDYARIYVILGGMLLIGSVVLGNLISRIKMDQALKLGED